MLLLMLMMLCLARTCLAILFLAMPESLLEKKSRKFSIEWILIRCDVMPTTIGSKDIVIAPMTAVFFLSNRPSDWQGDGPLVTFKPYDPDDPNNTTSIDYARGENVNRNLNQLCIEVHEADTLRDRAYVKTGEGSSCRKFIFNPDTPKLFIPMGDKDYALAYTDGAKVMPLNFIYKKHGTYTLTFDTEAIECDYLHLIDNGTSTLQVFDILGRQILTKEISTLNSQLSTSLRACMCCASAMAKT